MDFKVKYKVENKIKSPALGSTRFYGEIGKRIDTFCRERVTGKDARELINKEAEKAFEEKIDDQFSYGLWRSEFWGKLFVSAARVCRMYGDEEFKEYIRSAAYSLLKYQREDGYLNTYKNSRNVFKADPKVTIHEIGWPCTFNWNIWGRKYTLWALLECATLLDDGKILDAADRMAAQLLCEVKDLGVRLKDTGVLQGLPSCSILKPMLLLYRLTAKKEYLDFCLDIAKEWEREDNECPNLLTSPLSGKAPAEWFDIAEKDGTEWSAKAYEMMSCYDGLCELYRVTGEEKYIHCVKALYEVLIKYESNILGSVGYCETFVNSSDYPDSATEICDVIHWMRICYELFSLTGEVKYMHSFERAYVNAFFAGVYEDGKSGAFFIRSSGRHMTGKPQCDTTYQHCCVNNVPRGFANAAEAAVMFSDDKIYVNMFVPAKCVSGDVNVEIGNGYFTSGCVDIGYSGVQPGTSLMIRIPEWSRKTTLFHNGSEIAASCGEYAEIRVSGTSGKINVKFDMTPEVLPYAGSTENRFDALPYEDYHIRRWCDEHGGAANRTLMLKNPKSTVRRGALILARSKKLGAAKEEMFSQDTVFGKNCLSAATASEADGFLAKVHLSVVADGEEHTYEMCDYASCANLDLEDVYFFSVFI